MADPRYARSGARAETQVASLAQARQAKALFFAAAGLSFLASISLFLLGDPELGIWVPSMCAAGALLLAGELHD